MTTAEQQAVYNTKYYHKNKVKILKKQAEYRIKNADKIFKQALIYRAKNIDAIRKRSNEYHANNPEQSVLRSMIRRCHDPNDNYYELYGGRGITVCDRWRDQEHGLANFIADAGLKWNTDNHYHRIESDQGYYKQNVVQIRRKLHMEIHGNAEWIFHDGILDTLTGWSSRLGFADAGGVHKRIYTLGWSRLEAVSVPKRNTGQRYQLFKEGKKSCSKVSRTECLNQLNPDVLDLTLVKSTVSDVPRIQRGNACLSSITWTQRELW
jgi:hypothetical protein